MTIRRSPNQKPKRKNKQRSHTHAYTCTTQVKRPPPVVGAFTSSSGGIAVTFKPKVFPSSPFFKKMSFCAPMSACLTVQVKYLSNKLTPFFCSAFFRLSFSESFGAWTSSTSTSLGVYQRSISGTPPTGLTKWSEASRCSSAMDFQTKNAASGRAEAEAENRPTSQLAPMAGKQWISN